MNLRGLSALGLLLVAVVLERVAYNGEHSVLLFQLRAQGMPLSETSRTQLMLQGILLVGTLACGAVGFVLGPRATAVVALLTTAAGYVALAAGAPITRSAALVFFGSGMFRPCVFAAAAEVLAGDDESPAALGPHRFAAVSAFAVATYAAATVGGLSSSLTGAAFRHGGWVDFYAVCGALAILAALLVAGAALLGLRTRARDMADAGPDRAAPPPAPSAQVFAAVVGVAILLGAQVVYVVGTSVTWVPPALLSGDGMSWLSRVNPVAALVASVFVFGLLLAATLRRRSLSLLSFYGAGLAVVGVGLGIVAVAGSSSAALYALGSAVTGSGEAAAYAIPLAYAALAVRGRTAMLVVAGFLAVLMLANTIISPLSHLEGVRTPTLVTCAILALGIAAVILVFARRLHRGLFDPPRPVD
jgi:hypothetical protein